MRKDGRAYDQMREMRIIPDYIKNVPASVLIEQGDTRVLCTGIYEEKVPFFLKSSSKGWVKAEYSMLPGSTGNERVNRERQRVNNRHIEIQRFVGRALRTTFDLEKINGMTLHIDTDVLQADGSTRCASLNSGMVVLVKMLKYLVYETIIPDLPEIEWIASVSIGVKDKNILVDLTYEEDYQADADINIVSSGKGNIVEVQAFGEEKTISKEIFQDVINLGVKKNIDIIDQLKKHV
ncbi:MAG: ribonuclease PH [Candidatus Aminicenantes bacterium]|nr:MAG: ribonuclease PH [Candidatus Aminicenantes bacterium]